MNQNEMSLAVIALIKTFGLDTIMGTAVHSSSSSSSSSASSSSSKS